MTGDVQHILTDRFSRAIKSAIGEQCAVDPLITVSHNPKFGDYQANVAMGLAKQLGRKPREIADLIVTELDVDDICAKIDVAGPGFINITLRHDFLSQHLQALGPNERLGVGRVEKPRNVVLDYSCPNLAKEMHIGHLRSSCIGDCLARVLAALGHHVIRQNHVGDWGTQFGMLIEHLIDTGWDQSASHAIGDLDAMYQASNERFNADADFADRARKRVVTLQAGDERVRAIWQMLVKESVRHMNAIYGQLDLMLTDDDIRAESYYNSMLPEVLSDLLQCGLLEESQGAKVVFPQGFVDRDGQPLPIIVQKRDGGYLYATTDLAAARYRVKQLGADWIIYVTDARQTQHFAMVFQVVRQADWADDRIQFDHVPFGTILGTNRKPFKTRQGNTVKLSDVLAEATQRAAAIIDEKAPELPADQRDQVARIVGIGALKYADLCSDRIKDYIFDWDRMLALDGNTAPYLQNAYVRTRSIFRKGQVNPSTLRDRRIVIHAAAERDVALKLLQFSSVVYAVAETLEPHRLCTYLYELASLFHKFYEQCPVLGAKDPALRDSRLLLCDLVCRVLEQGLDWLGIGVVEQM